MRKIAAWMLAVLLAVSPMSRAAMQTTQNGESAAEQATQAEAAPQENQDPVFEMWKAVSPPMKVTWLTNQVAGYLKLAKESGPQELDQIAKKYPLVSVGIEQGPSYKERGDAGGKIGIRITAVYVGSPADKAGVKPGDWIEGINDMAVCAISYTEEEISVPENREAKIKEIKDCAASAGKALEESSGDTAVSAQRDGNTQTFSLAKEPIGQELATELAGRMDGWKQAFASIVSNLTALAERVKTAGENSAELDVCYLELEKQKAAFSETQREFADVYTKHVRMLPREE